MQSLKLLTLTALASWFIPGTLLSAGLVWEQKSLNFNPAISDIEVVAHFKFQNKGTAAITMKPLTTSCSCCTTATTSKQSYMPGEEGEVVAKFSIEDRFGVQTKEIYVETDAPSEPRTTLKMVVMVPKLAEVEPDPLCWTPGEPLQPKRIHVTAAKGVAMKLAAVRLSDPGISAQIKPGARPGEFEVIVTPRGDGPAFSGCLRIETDFPKEHPKSLLAHVQISR